MDSDEKEPSGHISPDGSVVYGNPRLSELAHLPGSLPSRKSLTNLSSTPLRALSKRASIAASGVSRALIWGHQRVSCADSCIGEHIAAGCEPRTGRSC